MNGQLGFADAREKAGAEPAGVNQPSTEARRAPVAPSVDDERETDVALRTQPN